MATAFVSLVEATPASAGSFTFPGVTLTSDQRAIVAVMQRGDVTFDAVTFNGSGTGWSSIGDTTELNGARCHAWSAVGLSGTGDIVATLSGTATFAHCVLVLVTDAPTVGTVQAGSANGATSLTLPNVSTSDANGLVFSVCYVRDNDATLTAASPSTERHSTNEGVFGSASASLTRAGGTNVSTGFTWTNGASATGLAIPLNAAASGGRVTKNTRAWPLGVNVGMGFRMNG